MCAFLSLIIPNLFSIIFCIETLFLFLHASKDIRTHPPLYEEESNFFTLFSTLHTVLSSDYYALMLLFIVGLCFHSVIF